MLYRKIASRIEEYLSSDSDRMLLIDGARQIGKSYIISWVGKKMFSNYIEINMEEDKLGDRVFAEAKTTSDFYMALSLVAGDKMKDKANTLVFIDEIQAYDHDERKEIYLYCQWLAVRRDIEEYAVCADRKFGYSTYVSNGLRGVSLC